MIKSLWQEHRRRKAAQARLDEIGERAAKLGITPERVLEEYRRIAFANLKHIVDWDNGAMRIKAADELSDDDVAAIAEIVQSAARDGKPYRVKLYDKRAALDAIARYLGMIPLASPAAAQEDEPTTHDPQGARQRLIDELDRLAAEETARSGAQRPER